MNLILEMLGRYSALFLLPFAPLAGVVVCTCTLGLIIKVDAVLFPQTNSGTHHEQEG